MPSATGFLLLAAGLVMSAESACPTGMTEVGHQPWCVRYYEQLMTFCDALKTCYKHGQEMVSKPVYEAIRASALNQPRFWWVGLVDALNERGSKKDGWVWIKDGQVTGVGERDFDEDEPNNIGNKDCVTTMSPSILLRNENCTERNTFYCYLDVTAAIRATAKLNHGKFERVKIPVFHQPDPGCWIRAPSAKTVFGCSRACLQFEFGDCVGFYWHPIRRQCVLLPYFDASVPLDGSEFSASEQEKLQWTKYWSMH